MNYREVRLGDVLELERIPVSLSTNRMYTQIGIRSFGRGIFHREPVAEEGLSKLRYFEIQPDRLIVSNIMAWEGAIAVSGQGEAGCVGSARFLSYRPADEVDLNYLNYFFQRDQGRSLIADASSGSVKRNQTLSPANFERLRVPLPDLSEQRRIASKLDLAMAKIAQANGLRKIAQKSRTALRESLIAQVTNTTPKMVGSVIELMRRAVDVKPDGLYREIGLRSFGKGVFHKPSVIGESLGEKRIFSVEPGDLLFSSVFAWEGAVARATDAEQGRVGSHRFMTYVVDEDVVDADYLRFFFLSASGLEVLRRCSPGGAGRNKTLGIKAFQAEHIPVPPLSEQQRIARMLTAAEQISIRLSAEYDQRAALCRTALLNAAFTGRL